MKKILLISGLFIFLVSCRSSFNSFYNNHKTDIGATSFQVPKLMKPLIGSISHEVGQAIGHISDFKFIKFENIDDLKRQALINEMNAVTKRKYVDVFRKNKIENTQIIAVKEKGTAVTDIVIFNSNEKVTITFYLKGLFDAAKIRRLAEEKGFDSLTNSLLQSYSQNLDS